MATVEVYFANGDYQSFDSTMLPFGDGYLIASENIYLDIDKIQKDGIVWERDFYASETEDPEQNGLKIATMQILSAEELKEAMLICLNGHNYIARNDDGELQFIFFGEPDEAQPEAELSDEEMQEIMAEANEI